MLKEGKMGSRYSQATDVCYIFISQRLTTAHRRAKVDPILDLPN